METLHQRASAAYQIVKQRFGYRFSPLLSYALFRSLRGVNTIGQQLDRMVFPRLRRTVIDKPIVIAGLPRTGTTFLQRFLHANRMGVGSPLWKMLYSSLCVQRCIGPLIPFLEGFSPARFHQKEVHESGLLHVETDDVGIFFRHLDGFFLYGFLFSQADEELRHHFDQHIRNTSVRDFSHLRQSWQRNIYGLQNARVLAKNFSLGANLPAFLQHFPDAKIIYTARDPERTIPSTLSLLYGVLCQRFQFQKLDAGLQKRYFHRLRDALIELMHRFHCDYEADRFDKKQVMILPFGRLKNDFPTVMKELSAFLEVQPDEQCQQAILQQSQKQSRYRSGHRYALQDFDLQANRIKERCAFFEPYWQES